jgi:hypothetical protein
LALFQRWKIKNKNKKEEPKTCLLILGFGLGWMGIDSYTDVGVTHAELLLVTCLKRKTLQEIKTSSCKYISNK